MKNDNKPADKTQESFDIKEAAKFLGVSIVTLKRWRKSGKLVPDTISQTKSKRGPKLVSNYSFAQLKLVSNSKYEHQKKVTNSETGITFDETSIKFDSEKVHNETAQTAQAVTKAGNKPKQLVKSDLTYVVEGAETLIQSAAFVSPNTLFSPKDKVSNMTWNNTIQCNEDRPVVTVKKSEDFGCIVRLNYDKIFADEHVITSANFSDFDRALYDAVVTLMVAGNNIFSNTALWRVITQKSDAKLTDSTRLKIVKSMFHIGNFLISIVTDYSKKADVWADFNSDSTQRPFKSERKFYKKLQAIYGGRLLEFRWIAERSITITRTVDGQEIIERKDIPEIWQFIAPPILYQYAADKEQVASIAMTLLNTSDKTDNKPALRRGSHTNELANFLTREIDTMKKSPTYSKIIILDRIYSIDGIDEVQNDANSLKQKKKYTRGKIDKILTRFKTNGMIKGYLFHKKVIGKATTFYSVEILI